MPFATTIDNKILDHFFEKATWTADAQRFLGLSSTTPTKAGANITEPSGGAYARVEIADANMDAASSSATTNNAEKAFAQATADWVGGSNLTAMILMTAVSAGSMLAFKLLTVAKPVLNGDTAKFAAGDLDFSIGGSN